MYFLCVHITVLHFSVFQKINVNISVNIVISSDMADHVLQMTGRNIQEKY